MRNGKFGFWFSQVCLLWLLGLDSCQQDQRLKIECFQMVYQNPTPEFLKTFPVRDLPRNRLFFFVRINGIEQIEQLDITLICREKSLTIDLQPLPTEKGVKQEAGIYLLMATKEPRHSDIVPDLVAYCSAFQLDYTINKVSGTTTLPNKWNKKTEYLSVSEALTIIREDNAHRK